MMKRFLLYTLLFFLPVVTTMVAIELLVKNIPAGYHYVSQQMENNAKDKELLIFGSSQVQGAFNPAFIDIPSINFASGSQHHSEDYKIFEQVYAKFTNAKYVVFEVSYAHFEIPHNETNFWKNSIYLHYYGVNNFERNTYFKDKLLFISNPDFYSQLLTDYYFNNDNKALFNFNKHGFLKQKVHSEFQKLHFDSVAINNRDFRIRTKENIQVFNYNTTYFNNMLTQAIDKGFKVVIVAVPVYKTYAAARNKAILHRRDSVLKHIQQHYKNVSVFNLENDSINFNIQDFSNENHLNAKGAKKYAQLFNNFMTSQ